ncbi:MAG: capsular biosynthesis protein, partial [Finegoldia magna]|nr:capsular biosynthesis protein [Finegoldia magna]
LGFDIKDYPNTFEQYKNEITLPLHTLLSDDEVAYVIETYKDRVSGK